MPALNDIHGRYKDRAAFYVVYIQEAHPIDGWQVESNLKDDVMVESTHTAEARGEAAGRCVKELGLELPALLDEPDDTVEDAYTGWPDRLYVVDEQGRIAYKSAAGPFGFKPEEMEAALLRLVPPADPPPDSTAPVS